MLRRDRLVIKFNYQPNYGRIHTWVDTDYAGCTKTRRSTSAGVLNYGSHVIKTWSVTQKNLALSSGEAEYSGIVKGASVSLGI